MKPNQMEYLNELNEIQRQAVEHLEGPLMIIAGPGSGKTRVLTYRIVHLINQGIDPFNILSLTFTNKAAREMKARIEKLVGTEARNLYIGTFHSVFARILRSEAERLNYPKNFSIYDTKDSKNLIKDIIKEQNLNTDIYKPNVVYNRISKAKNALLFPNQYAANAQWVGEDEQSGRKRLKDLYRIYVERCFKSNAMDFDDLLLKMYELLIKFPEARATYSERFQFVMIDEFQDTNTAQYAVVNILAEKHKNIGVVGDDAQSIYAFRGATIQNILNFEKDYPDLRVYKLEQNYRSTQSIVKVANELIKHNRNQLPKTIWTENKAGDVIKVVKTASDNDEGKRVAQTIQEEQHRHHYKNQEFAILYRTNAQSRAMEDALRRCNIPYVVYGGTSFYQRKEIKDFLAYLRIIVNPQDEEALKRIVNYPTRGIGATTIQKCAIIANQHNISLWSVLDDIDNPTYKFNKRVHTAVQKFTIMIKSLKTSLDKKDAFELAKEAAKASGLQPHLHNDKSVEGLSRFDNFQELLNSIKEFVEADEVNSIGGDVTDKLLGTYLQQVSLMTDQDKTNENDDAVKLMTIHAAKGLEFPVVFIVGLEEDLFPSRMSRDTREGLEEERRLFYVAVTRAETKLYMSWAAVRIRYGKFEKPEPSRFIEEVKDCGVEFVGYSQSDRRVRKEKESGFSLGLRSKNSGIPHQARQEDTSIVPSPSNEIQVGKKVKHSRFGVGVVVDDEEKGANRKVVINFQGMGEKKIWLKFAKIQVIE